MRRLPIGFLALLTLWALGAGCYNPDLEARWARGSQLRLGVGALQTTDQVVFLQGGEGKVIQATEGKTLVAVPVRLVNDRTGKALLYVDEGAAVLRDVRSRNYPLIDPFARAVLAEGPVDEEKVLTPFLWGNLTLEQNFQVSGWLIFEVPPDREWLELEWRQGDTIVARFQS